jgi:hypothetical protein
MNNAESRITSAEAARIVRQMDKRSNWYLNLDRLEKNSGRKKNRGGNDFETLSQNKKEKIRRIKDKIVQLQKSDSSRLYLIDRTLEIARSVDGLEKKQSKKIIHLENLVNKGKEIRENLPILKQEFERLILAKNNRIFTDGKRRLDQVREEAKLSRGSKTKTRSTIFETEQPTVSQKEKTVKKRKGKEKDGDAKQTESNWLDNIPGITNDTKKTIEAYFEAGGDLGKASEILGHTKTKQQIQVTVSVSLKKQGRK